MAPTLSEIRASACTQLFTSDPCLGSQLYQLCDRHLPKQVYCNPGYKKLEGLSPRQHGPQRQYQGQDSLIAALEEKYVLSQPSEALQNSSSSESLDCIPQEPIHMLGGMVSPHLVQAKASLHILLFSICLRGPAFEHLIAGALIHCFPRSCRMRDLAQ